MVSDRCFRGFWKFGTIALKTPNWSAERSTLPGPGLGKPNAVSRNIVLIATTKLDLSEYYSFYSSTLATVKEAVFLNENNHFLICNFVVFLKIQVFSMLLY